jgi:hypothetical protein
MTMEYAIQLGVWMLVLFLLGCLIGAVAFNQFGRNEP